MDLYGLMHHRPNPGWAACWAPRLHHLCASTALLSSVFHVFSTAQLWNGEKEVMALDWREPSFSERADPSQQEEEHENFWKKSSYVLSFHNKRAAERTVLKPCPPTPAPALCCTLSNCRVCMKTRCRSADIALRLQTITFWKKSQFIQSNCIESILTRVVCEQNSGYTNSRCKVILFLCACKTGQQHYYFRDSLRSKLGQFLPLCWWDVTTEHCTLALAVQQLHGLCWPPAPRPDKSAWFNLTFKSKRN